MIDIRNNIKNINIYRKDSDGFVDIIEMEEYGNIIIIS
jgi:hypothetical protein